jgi:hypothetical protein
LLASDPAEAAKLYDGPLLDGLSIPDPAFDEWLATTRSELHTTVCDALQRAGDVAASRGDTKQGIDAASIRERRPGRRAAAVPGLHRDTEARTSGRPRRGDPDVIRGDQAGLQIQRENGTIVRIARHITPIAGQTLDRGAAF